MAPVPLFAMADDIGRVQPSHIPRAEMLRGEGFEAAFYAGENRGLRHCKGPRLLCFGAWKTMVIMTYQSILEHRSRFRNLARCSKVLFGRIARAETGMPKTGATFGTMS